MCVYSYICIYTIHYKTCKTKYKDDSKILSTMTKLALSPQCREGTKCFFKETLPLSIVELVASFVTKQ